MEYITNEMQLEAIRKKQPKKTNFQRITASPEALAEFMVGSADCNNCPNEKSVCQNKYENCKETWLVWLKQESKDE